MTHKALRRAERDEKRMWLQRRRKRLDRAIMVADQSGDITVLVEQQQPSGIIGVLVVNRTKGTRRVI